MSWNKRGVFNRAKSPVVCNASATNFRVPPDFLGTFGYPNVNQLQQYTIQTPQGAAWPLRTFVLGGFLFWYLSEERCDTIKEIEKID